MGNATATISAAAITTISSAADCGCCKPEPKTVNDVIRELESRRELLEARLESLGAR